MNELRSSAGDEKTVRPAMCKVKAIAWQQVWPVTAKLTTSEMRGERCRQLLTLDGVWYSANSSNRRLEPWAEGRMKLPKYALDILVCPVCKTKVELLSDESGLKCSSCCRIYPVRDEIPVMLPEEAKIVEDASNG
jgi:uncharacterized protein YbaR (Trm112 family)